jgi:hypothetical protein
MNTESLKELQESLRKVLFNKWIPSQLEKANLIVSLCNYYNSDNKNSEINDELKKLNSMLLNYELLEKLTNNLYSITNKNFLWEPHFHRDEMPQNINLSPTFNIGTIDLSGILNEIDKIRAEINNQPINFNLLISFISKEAKETGDLNKEVKEKD